MLEESATDIFSPGFDIKSGAGRLNAGAAMNMIGDPTKQIIHPDSLISSSIVQRDTIALAYNRAFVADGWRPVSQTIPLEQERQYKVERVFVENTYSFADYFNATVLEPDGSFTTFGETELGTLWQSDELNFGFTPDNLFFSKRLTGLYLFDNYQKQILYAEDEFRKTYSDLDTLFLIRGNDNILKYTYHWIRKY